MTNGSPAAEEAAKREIRVALYCDEPVMVAGLRTLLSARPELQIVCTSNTLSDFFGSLDHLQPDIALVDAPPQMGLHSIVEMSRRAPGCRIVLWVHSINIQLAHELREAGIAGVLRKQLSGDLIIRCLEKVAAGELWFERELMSSLLDARPVRLSPRERQLVDLVSQGLSNKQIASALSISEGTVKVYFSKLFRKVGVSDRFELALLGLRNLRLDDTPGEQKNHRSILLRSNLPKRLSVA